MERYDILLFSYKNNVRYGRYLQLFVEGLMSYLCYVCLLAYSGVKYDLTIGVTWRVS